MSDFRKRVEELKQRGFTLPRHPVEAQKEINAMAKMASSRGEVERDLGIKGFRDRTAFVPGRGSSSEDIGDIEQNARLIRAMKMQRTASSDASIAIPRFYDPMEFWDLSGLPWNMADEGHRHKLHKWLRLFYATHYLVPILVDIFTRFPLAGMHLTCKDKKLEEWYTDLFFDRLDYESFLVEMGREVWTVGEAFALGSFDEAQGIWEREELIRPELVIVENVAPLGNQIMKLVPSESLKHLARTKMPASEYKQLEESFPEIIPYLMRDEPIPVSDVLLKQVAFKQNNWDAHGTPILLRALRTLIHEEKLMASQDAIAERLYSPLILAKLGSPDMGGDYGPWLPEPEQLEEFRDDLDVALSSDFRVMAYHYALDMQNVFGREQVPDLGNDFDRIERRLMQVFGINPSLLAGGSSAQPYASSALHAEFMNQILRTFQKYLKEHYRQRALVVAEAQGHYDYEKKGDKRIPILEDVVEHDSEGNMIITQRPKLLVPDMEMPVLDVRDEATERAFRSQLRGMGVPIPDDKLMVGMNHEFDDLLDEMGEETMKKTIRQQEMKMETYIALRDKGLPIPPDLRAEVEGVAPSPGGAPGAPGGLGGEMGGPPPMGGEMGGPPPAGGGGTVMAPPLPNDLAGDLGPMAEPFGAGPAGNRPPSSDEQRGQMPKP